MCPEDDSVFGSLAQFVLALRGCSRCANMLCQSHIPEAEMNELQEKKKGWWGFNSRLVSVHELHVYKSMIINCFSLEYHVSAQITREDLSQSHTFGVLHMLYRKPAEATVDCGWCQSTEVLWPKFHPRFSRAAVTAFSLLPFLQQFSPSAPPPLLPQKKKK